MGWRVPTNARCGQAGMRTMQGRRTAMALPWDRFLLQERPLPSQKVCSTGCL